MKQIMYRAQRAIIDLDLRVDNNVYDKLELAEILVEILDYPDLLLARSHQLANKIGNYDLFQNRSQLAKDLQQNQKHIDGTPICDCCGLIIHKQSVPFCTPLSDINLGLGTRLYLNSLLYIALIFSVTTVLFSIYSVITNVEACKQKTIMACGIEGLGISYKMIDVNNSQNYLYTSSILGIILASFWGIIEVIKNHQQKKIAIDLTVRFIQASQFTLMLHKFPSNLLKQTYQQNLQMITEIFKNFQERIDAEYGNKKRKKQQGLHLNYKVAKINIARNLYVEKQKNFAEKQKLKKAYKQKQDLFREWIIYRKSHNRFYSTLQQREEKYGQYLDFYTKQFDKEEKYEGKDDENVIIFVTFQDSKAREEIQMYGKQGNIWNLFNLFRKDLFPVDGVKIRKAPPPQQIKWMNIGFPYKIKLLRIFLVYGVSILFLAASLGMTYGLNQIQNSDIGVSIIISVVITGVNLGLQFLIMWLSKYLNQITESSVQFNIGFKICLFQILNVIGVPLLALYISKKSLYGQNGLSQDIFFIALFNILPPLGRFIDPYYILVSLRNKFYSRPGKSFPMRRYSYMIIIRYHLKLYFLIEYRLRNFESQKQFNKIYEDNDFDLGYEYAYVIKTSIFTSFFLSLQPIISIFAVIGLLLMFFINKYRLLYRFYKPRYYSSTVNTLVGYLLALSPLFFALGMLVFTNWQNQFYFKGTLYLNWTIFIIGGFFFFFPFRILYKCITQPTLPQLKYSEQKPTLPSQYDRMNPITKSQAIDEHQQYLKDLQAHKLLSPQAKMFNQSIIKMSNQEMRRSRIYAIDDFKSTIKSRIHQNNDTVKNTIQIQLQNPNSPDNIRQKPLYNLNLESYDNFIKACKDNQQL